MAADIGWRRSRGSTPAARTGARQRAGLTPASASTHFHASGRRFTHNSSGQIKKSIDSDHGIYRDLRNVVAKRPIETPHRFCGIQRNSGH
jgi:hypothetical protein